MTSGRTIVVMAKEPVAGRVKTRLCPPFTPSDAAELAAAALHDTMDAVRGTSCARRILALDGTPGAWLPSDVAVVPQAGGGLDARIGAVLARCAGATVVIGMDTPQVTSGLLEDAFRRLHRGWDAVLGPAHDGGFWLLGLAKPRADAVVGVPMSTAHTGAAQRAQLDALGLTTATTVTLRDVDTAADAAEVAQVATCTRFAATFERCAAALASSQALP